MKKITASILALALFLTAFTTAGFAQGDSPVVPGATVAFEKAGGAIASVLGRFLKTITLWDEARIEKAKPLDETWTPFSHGLFEGEGEQTLEAETWRMVELSYESGKTYGDPFNDVTVDLELSGCGRDLAAVDRMLAKRCDTVIELAAGNVVFHKGGLPL